MFIGAIFTHRALVTRAFVVYTIYMFKRISLGLCLLASALAWANDVPEQALSHKIDRANAVAQNKQGATWRRFLYMRFYKLSDRLPDSPSLWEELFSSASTQGQERALAVYLFNMHVSTKLYKTPQVSEISLHYLGVLDGLVRAQEPFDYSQARSFYQEHRESVQTILQSFLSEPAPSEAQIEQWLMRLEQVPTRHKKAAYRWAELPAVTVPPAATQRLLLPWQQALREAEQQVIVYDQPDVHLEDLDRSIGNTTYRRKRTYRWIKEECFYSSYLAAKQLVQHISRFPTGWDTTRIYLLTAYPQTGEFLTPSAGQHFGQAQTPSWRYHTAVLVVLDKERQFIPLVLDRFLAGKTPMPLDQWARNFSPQTVFTAVPFVRSKRTEQAFHIPQKTEGQTVWIDGNKYEPAEVLP